MEKKLYVGGLPYSVDQSELQTLFSKAGTVDSANVIIDKMTGRSKGFGFVEMSTEDEANKAIDMYNGANVGGRNITVNKARPQEDRPARSTGSYDRNNDRRRKNSW
jgi:RNA recognition motif-containing protein